MTLYAIRFRGVYKGDGKPDPDTEGVGEILWRPLTWILEEINQDRSPGWTDYDENDWSEGLDEWTLFEPVLDEDGKPMNKEGYDQWLNL